MNACTDVRADALPLLFIGGMGRSGSTLLERLVGQLPGVCNLGEVVWIWDRGVRCNERCGCGEPFHECPFWTAVGTTAFGGWHNVDLDRIGLLARTVDDVKYAPRMLLPRSTADFDARRAEYTGYFHRIYEAAAGISRAATIVDSSKLTALAYALSHEPGVDLRLLHLVRDPRGVTHAWTRLVARPEVTDEVVYMPQYRASYMAALWSGHNVLLSALRLRHVRTQRVRYEDFAADPAATLSCVSSFLGHPVAAHDIDFVDGSAAILRPTHSVAGNPMRFDTGPVTIRRDERWIAEMPPWRRRLVTTITAPTALAFGYVPWRTPVATASRAPDGPPPGDDPEPEWWPSVTAVIPSHGRPELLRGAVASILGQQYDGALDVIVVHDKESIDDRLRTEFEGRVTAIGNARTPGLCGARNTGILAAHSDLVAFCDDDDRWLPGKLRRQVMRLQAMPGAVLASTAMNVDFAGTTSVRLAGTLDVTYDRLLRSRMAMLHSSSFLVRREAMASGLGLLNEEIPGSMGEDWDLLLRAARLGPIAHLDEPLVEILWGSTSFFSRDWTTRLQANTWFLQHYPDIARNAPGIARLLGQNAFFAAAGGDRRQAALWVGRTLRTKVTEPRAWLALPVIVAPGLGNLIMGVLHRTGRGI